MKYIFRILGIGFLLFLSCNNNELKPPYENNFNSSLKQWENLKSLYGNSYKYQIRIESWAGFGRITEITVIDNVVTHRKGEAYNLYNEDDQHLGWDNRIITESFSEEQTNLGSHDFFALPVTIDELYTSCINEYLTVDPNQNTIYFEVQENGILKNCSYFPKNCADDCLVGVSIHYFEWL